MTRQNPANIALLITLFLSITVAFGISRETAGQNGGAAVAKLTKCSEIRTDTPFSDAVATDSQRVFIGTIDGNVQAIDTGLGAGVWLSELGGEIVSNIIATENGVVVISNPLQTGASVAAESTLRSLSKQTGVPNFTVRLPYSNRFYLGSSDGYLLVVNDDGLVTSVDMQSGRILWRTRPLGKITARPFFSKHGIAIGTGEKQIYLISGTTGDILFKAATSFIPTAIANPTSEVIVVGDERGNVTSVDIPDGKSVWKFKSGAAVSFLSVTKEGLFITSHDNFLYLVSMYNGDVLWKRRLPGRAVEGGLILEGHILLLIYGENSAFLIETNKGKVVDQLIHSDSNFVSHMPVALKDGRVVISAADSILTYSMNGCGTK